MSRGEDSAVIERDAFRGGLSASDGDLFTLLADDGSAATVTSYGARLVSLEIPAGCGRLVDVVLGLPTLGAYRQDRSAYFGATVGHYAGRNYGGPEGFDARVWQGEQRDQRTVRLALTSSDGDQALDVEVTYALQYRALRIDYAAHTDTATVVKLSNHSYFNLAGEGEGRIGDHVLQIAASHYTPIDPTLIPLGPISHVQGTPFDFRTPRQIGMGLASPDHQLALAGGYDHYFALDGGVTQQPRPVARLFCPRSGLLMTVLTTEPGLQLYSGNALDGSHSGKSGSPYLRHGGLCLETQHYPDSPNQPLFLTTLLRPGVESRSTTIFRFA